MAKEKVKTSVPDLEMAEGDAEASAVGGDELLSMFDELERTLSGDDTPEGEIEDDEEYEDEDEDEEEVDEEEDDDEESEDDDEEEEVSSGSDDISSLREQISALQEQLQQIKAADKKAPEQEDAALPPIDLSKVVPDDEAFENIIADRGNFMAFLENFTQVVRAKILQDMPVVVGETVQRQATVRQTVTEFYDKNSDLAPFKRFVGFQVQQVQAEHPEWQVPQVLDEAAKRARTELSLVKKASNTETARQQKKKKEQPTFAKKPRGQRSRGASTPSTDEQQQIADMLGI